MGMNSVDDTQNFLRDWVQDAVSIVHLLPFFPFTSDDGFAVSDYRVVDPANGDWNDIAALSADYALAFDYVVNHASSAHAYFRQFLNDEAPGRTYFMTAPGDAGMSKASRGREPIRFCKSTRPRGAHDGFGVHSLGTKWIGISPTPRSCMSLSSC